MNGGRARPQLARRGEGAPTILEHDQEHERKQEQD